MNRRRHTVRRRSERRPMRPQRSRLHQPADIAAVPTAETHLHYVTLMCHRPLAAAGKGVSGAAIAGAHSDIAPTTRSAAGGLVLGMTSSNSLRPTNSTRSIHFSRTTSAPTRKSPAGLSRAWIG